MNPQSHNTTQTNMTQTFEIPTILSSRLVRFIVRTNYPINPDQLIDSIHSTLSLCCGWTVHFDHTQYHWILTHPAPPNLNQLIGEDADTDRENECIALYLYKEPMDNQCVRYALEIRQLSGTRHPVAAGTNIEDNVPISPLYMRGKLQHVFTTMFN
jgi:hypothetical protein